MMSIQRHELLLYKVARLDVSHERVLPRLIKCSEVKSSIKSDRPDLLYRDSLLYINVLVGISKKE